MSEDRKLYVRLKPFNPKTGCLVQRYLIGDFSFITDSTSGRPVWNIIHESTVIKHDLAQLRQIEGDLRSQLLLDIVTEEQYKQIEEIEKQRRLSQLGFSAATESIPADPTPVKDRTGGRVDAIPEPEIPAAVEPLKFNPDALSVKDIRDDADVNRLPLADEGVETAPIEEAPPEAAKRGRGRPRGRGKHKSD